jgi:hypothetical protein
MTFGTGKSLCCLRPLCAVLGTGLLAVSNTCCIEGSADYVITSTGKVLDTAASDHDYAMLLKVVAFTGDIAGDLDSVGKTYTGDLPESRIRLLGGRCLYSGADTSLLRRSISCGLLLQRVEGSAERRGLGLLCESLSALPY